MAANYWESTQRRFWLFSKDDLGAVRQKLEDDNADLVQMFSLPQQRHLGVYFNQRLFPPAFLRRDCLTDSNHRG